MCFDLKSLHGPTPNVKKYIARVMMHANIFN